MKFLLSLFTFAALTINAYAAPRYLVKERELDTVTKKEKFTNFGVVYGAQWTYYLIGQREIIDEYGSFRNWHQNMFSPHFDKDSFDYNIFKHTLTGNYYYLWYRSRGYEESDSLVWSFISSLTFEFTIETATERPSWQDIYQTPVFGTAMGYGVEKLSLYFHEWDNWYGHTLGYILNPFTLLPRSRSAEVTIAPIINKGTTGAYATYRF